MARSILETRFTGDDTHFQRVRKRVMAGGAKMEGTFRKVNAGMGAIGAAGGGFALKGLLDKYDRIGKLAKQFGLTAEQFQRFEFVANQNGATVEQLAKAMGSANAAAAEAVSGIASYNDEFIALNINAEKFAAMNQAEQFYTLADAVKNATNRNQALASIQKIMGRNGRELIPILQQGGDAARELGESIAVASDDSVASIERLNDSLGRLKANVLGPVADGVAAYADAIEGAALTTSGFVALLQGVAAGAIDPNISMLEGITAAIEEWEDAEISKAEKSLDDMYNRMGGRVAQLRDDTEEIKSAEEGVFRSNSGVSARPYEAPVSIHTTTNASATPLSAAAKKSNADRDKFFKDAKSILTEGQANSDRITRILESWE